MSAKCRRQHSEMGISRSSTPRRRHMVTALSCVLSVVPKPGIVTARMSEAGRFSARQAREQMSRASVESSPPEMPMTSRCAQVCSILLARPAVWMEMISSHRFPAAGRRRQKGPCRVESVFQAGRSGNLFRQGQMQGIPGREKGFAVIEGAFREARRLQPFKIHVRKDEGAFPAEPFPLRCWPAVVRNEGMAAEYGVRGGFMHTCGGKDIGTEASAALLSGPVPSCMRPYR